MSVNSDMEAQSPEVAAEAAQDAAGDPVAALTAEREQLAQGKADLEDRLLRNRAEFDNFRRRADRDRAEFFEYASMEAVKALLPIVDDFERALKAESADKEYAKGMELIYSRVQEQLKKLGLEPVESMGKIFDPNLHHAVDKAVRDDLEENTVLEEFQRGYNFKGRLLRPAMVKVAVGS